MIVSNALAGTAGPFDLQWLMKKDQLKQMLSGFQLLEAGEYLSDKFTHYLLHQGILSRLSVILKCQEHLNQVHLTLLLIPRAEICSLQSLFQNTDCAFLSFVGPPLQS